MSARARASQPGRGRPKQFRPQLLALEDRTTPAVAIQRSFTGLAFPDSNGGFVPPDTTAAAGPNHVVHAVNNSVAIYNKNTGQRVLFQSAATFMGAGSVQADLFDPVVTYDEGVGRFFVFYVAENDNAATAQLFVAVSNTANPLQGFTERVAINVRQTNGAGTNLWADRPHVGFNREAVVVSLNMFTFPAATNPQFDHVQLRSITKSTLLDRNPNTVTSFANNRAANLGGSFVPTVMHTAPANSPMYLTQATGSGQIRVTRMTNVLSTNAGFADTSVAVNAYLQPPDAPQVGAATLLNTNDNRILNAEWRGNQLVATHTIGANNKAVARWYQFNVSGAPAVVQQGDIDPGAGIFTWMPSIAFAPGGFLAMTYMQSSATTAMSIYATGRGPTDALGTMPNRTLIRQGARTYSAFDGSPFRTGDYSATTVDPVNNTFWVANEYATAAAQNNWGCWIANVRVPGQAPPTPPGPPAPGPAVFPGVFVRNYTEPNDTSDQAAYLGTVTRGVNLMPGLKIVRNALGFPDYDWFHFRIQRNGRLTVTNTITSGQPLEMTLWRRVGDNLVLIGRVRTRPAGFSRIFAQVRLGEELYVGVQGVNFAPGQMTQASYNMRYTLL
ncbi:MAG: hypothetical protein U0797_06625 [Gemmataceae bacterium]